MKDFMLNKNNDNQIEQTYDVIMATIEDKVVEFHNLKEELKNKEITFKDIRRTQKQIAKKQTAKLKLFFLNMFDVINKQEEISPIVDIEDYIPVEEKKNGSSKNIKLGNSLINYFKNKKLSDNIETEMSNSNDLPITEVVDEETLKRQKKEEEFFEKLMDFKPLITDEEINSMRK